MHHLWVLLIAFAAWILWVPACILEKEVEERDGSFSITPVIPLFPLLAWGIACLSPRIALVVAVLHGVFILALFISIVKSKLIIRARKKAG